MRALAVIGLLLCAPLSAFAQDEEKVGFHSVGAFVGAEFDNEKDWLVLGLDTRIPIAIKHLEINPKYTFRPFDGGSITQFDANILHNYILADPGRLHPYVGAGIAIRHIGFDEPATGPKIDGTTKVGLNLISGTRLQMSPGARYEPFVNAQYTLIGGDEFSANPFVLTVGVSFLID
jgi:hypothetical protein